jgi:O-antigen ligase
VGTIRRHQASFARGTQEPIAQKPGFAVLYVYVAWAMTLFDLHFFLGSMIAPPLGQLGSLVFVPLILMMVVQGPAILAVEQRWVWYPPFLMLLVTAISGFFTAINVGNVREVVQPLLIYYVLALATLMYIRTARHAVPIILMFCWQFAWWAISARTSGMVQWHGTLGNYDSFGGLMVQGTGICVWFGMAARAKRLRWFLFGLAGYCVMGVVASNARGAFLSLIALAALIWLRSPRKLATAAAGAVAAVIVVVAAQLLFEGGTFWTEIQSVFTEGTSEGTGGSRWILWGAAFRIFKQQPILGVGAGNVGVFGAQFFHVGEVPGYENPGMLYGLDLHNSYMTVLSELGVVGIGAFIWLLVDFHLRNRAMRTPAAAQRWAALTGGKFDLRYLALGLEAANIANMLSGLFYSSLYHHWFYTVWAANRMLWAVTRPEMGPPAAPQAAPAVSGRRRRRLRA